MAATTYIACLLFLFVIPAGVYADVVIISLYDNVEDGFKFKKEGSTSQDIADFRVFLYEYENKLTKSCMKVVSFNFIKHEDPVDFFMVSCDLKEPFKTQKDMINIGNVAYLGIKKGYYIWAVYVLGTGKCVQRLYTNKAWEFLEEIEEMELTTEQCLKVIDRGQPLKAKEGIMAIHKKKLPPIGQTTARVISLYDTYVEDFKRDESKDQDREVRGRSTKVIVTSLKHQENGECARFVSIINTDTEDYLDSTVVSCDEEFTDDLVAVDDMIGFAGMVFVKDAENEPIWALFAEEDKHCVLKVYTDDKHLGLQPFNKRSLEWDECLAVVESKNIQGRWSVEAEDNKPKEITVSRSYDEAVQLLQKDMDVNIPMKDPNDPKYTKAEGPGFLEVPQPAPPASITLQAGVNSQRTQSDSQTTSGTGLVSSLRFQVGKMTSPASLTSAFAQARTLGTK